MRYIYIININAFLVLPINATDFIPLTLHTHARERVHYRYAARINIMCTPRIIIVYIYKFFTTVSPPSSLHRLQPVKFVFAQMHALLLRATPYTSTNPHQTRKPVPKYLLCWLAQRRLISSPELCSP